MIISSYPIVFIVLLEIMTLYMVKTFFFDFGKIHFAAPGFRKRATKEDPDDEDMKSEPDEGQADGVVKKDEQSDGEDPGTEVHGNQEDSDIRDMKYKLENFG